MTTVTKDSVVSLKEITEDTLRPFLKMKVAKDQRNLVAENSISIAQAYFSKNARFRGIYADETPVGFMMWAENTEEKEYFLWRLMIDADHQRMSFGAYAVRWLIDYIQKIPEANELMVSAVPGDNSPIPFYEKLGFVSTGKYEGEELVLKYSF